MERGAQYVKCPEVEVLIALCSKKFPWRTFNSLQNYCLFSSQLIFSNGMEKSGREERKGEEKSKYFSLDWGFFYIKKKYIEKSADFRLSSKKGQFPYFFLVLPIENTPCRVFWWFLFHSFYVSAEPSTALSSESSTLRPVTNWYLDRSPSPFFSHNCISHLQLL